MKKIILKIQNRKFWKKWKMQFLPFFHKGETYFSLKNENFENFIFQWKIFFAFMKKFKNQKFQFSKLFFSSKIFELEKISDIKIDVKFYRESIFGIYFGIGAFSHKRQGVTGVNSSESPSNGGETNFYNEAFILSPDRV